MAHAVMRRAVAAVSAAAVVALGLGVGGGAASAAQLSATVTTTNIVATKTLLGDGSVLPGEVVTYRTQFSVNTIIDRYLNKITDVHPAGFQYVPGSAKVTAAGTSSPTPSVDDANNKVSVSNSASAWMLSKTSNRTVSFEVSYKVPNSAPAGTFNSGLTFDVNTFGSTQTFNPIGVTIDVQSPPDAATTTTLVVPATANVGAAVELKATVDPAAAGGTVQFKDGGANIGGPVAVNGGSATLSHTFDAAGAKSITAVYSGGPGFTGSTSAASTVTVSVPDAATTTTLTVPATANVGAALDLSATVSPTPAGGTVQFKDGGAALGGPVTVVDGKATIPHAFDVAGSRSITAVFSGAPGFKASTSAAGIVNVSVPDVATTTVLSVPASAILGAPVELKATVSPAPAGGTVQFKNGDANIGAPVNMVDGKAILSHTFAAAGSHAVSAVFSGAPGFVGSSSAVQSVTVPVPDVVTSIVLTAPATADRGVVVEFSAVVSPTPNGGTVQFKDGSTPIGGPVNVVDGKAKLSHTLDKAGAHSISATYSGFEGFSGAGSQASTVTVAGAGAAGSIPFGS